jgi:transcriptional regulator with XRE-family HTH domain
MTTGERLAKKLHLARVLASLTQAQLQELSGVEIKTISSFETGSRIFSAKWIQIEALAGACGWSLADFFAWEPTEVEWSLVHEPLNEPVIPTGVRNILATEINGYPSAQSSLGHGGFGR